MGFRKIALILICSFSVSALWAQEPGRQHISVSWGFATTLGSNNVINKPTFINPSLEYGYFITDNISLGFSVGWAYNNEKGETEDRLSEDGASSIVTTYTERTLSLVPVQLQGRYFPFGKSRHLSPFITLSTGFQYGTFNITGESGINSHKSSVMGFVVTPDIGVRWYPGKAFRCNLDLRVGYQFGTNKWERYNDNKSQQRIGAQIAFGIAF